MYQILYFKDKKRFREKFFLIEKKNLKEQKRIYFLIAKMARF